MFLVLIQSISAIGGGLALAADPSGVDLGVSVGMLEHSPFPDVLIPGLFLTIMLGMFPAVVLYGLIMRPRLRAAEAMNIVKGYHWSWTFSYYLGILLVLWIVIQVCFLREIVMLHIIYAVLGVLIIVLTHLSSTRRCYIVEQ